jgi:hypothetical protein
MQLRFFAPVESIILPRSLAVLVMLMCLTVSLAQAQNGAQAGDPPIASLITVSAPDENGLVTLAGAAGAVFPGAQVAIRNLYTGALVYTQGGITGTFNAQIEATANTPFWISPAPTIPNTVRDQPGSLPGGPGTIIYARLPEGVDEAGVVTQLIVDGDLTDWTAYAQARVSPGVQALVNQNSFYVGLDGRSMPAEYQRAEVSFTLDGTLYALMLDPRLQEQTATLRRVEPNPADIGTLAVAAMQDDAIELRIPLASFSQVFGTEVDQATLEQIRFLGLENIEIASTFIAQPVPILAEVDGIVYLDEPLGSDATVFALAGTLAQGAYTWQGIGRVNTLNFEPGDTLRMQLDVRLNVPELPAGLTGLDMIGQLVLQPVVGADGVQVAGGLYSNNGWSDALTPGGLVIDNLRGEIVLGEARVPSPQVLRLEEQLVFGLNFTLTLPDMLPAGLYVPVFQGFGQIGDGEVFRWEENSLLGTGEGAPQPSWNRLPLVFNVGGMEAARLVWTLFQDTPSSGSRGVMAAEDHGALSNRVRFNSPTYILPRFLNGTDEPITYPLEPYLLNLMPNLYTTSAAPLLPLVFPSGRLNIAITKPNRTTLNINNVPLVQNQLSTAIQDERALFGAQSQVDVYRLTTLNPEVTAFTFDQYGPHEITLTGEVEDIWGNRYEGGGTYSVVIAEIFDILPGALSGTPYEVGDVFNPGLRLLPSAAAAVTITARVYPVDGSDLIEQTWSGEANANGYFHAEDDAFTFSTPGEYVIDYEARFTDDAGRLWAGSLRSAGVIAARESALIAHGQRGLANAFPPPEPQRPAWFNSQRYAPNVDDPLLYFPYFSGDVLWYADGRMVNPLVQVQDTTGAYTALLAETVPNIEVLAARDELPVYTTDAAEAYTYVSVIRPGVTIRQYVRGGAEGGLPFGWDGNDPSNGQTGVGGTGERPGDYVFLFGGAVVRGEVVRETAVYAALGIVIEPDSEQSRVFPPFSGQASGPNGGPLLVIDEQPVVLFFHPTGVQPGQVLTVGDTLSIAGQVAPTLASTVGVTITDPSGFVRQFNGTANRTGYYYNPINDFEVGVTGVWTVELRVQHEGLTSAGVVQPPYPQGSVLGAVSNRFEVYVVDADAQPLEWNETRQDFPVPASTPFNFNFSIPEGWSEAQVTHTLTLPSAIVEMGALPVSGSSFSYNFSPANINRDFPNYEINTPLDGVIGSDPVTLTFAVSGTNALGQTEIRTRTFHILHDRLITLE